ncbi:MAG TPA: 30S ribosomal protein S9 [Wolbachia sp.]|jgi:small subunit ribosomal protein S9|uniref:30S ribosomal protein S9 n=1 Tax=Wolbachia endosymbiont of Pentalonia nigronervosa TaxID=1301914 RepID=UPI000EE0E674|nr:30S ribosomal protein S9 [Wolbachia endosymbiont of Pentalonia nigronervosa]MBD0391552.1 30S ribosomal protein S9 [Wolbachia endosymbiont of Pentalonia nigronervosa]HCE59422.1 30S ribosomal protein S9 [Wolbachia sp.]
MKNLAVRKTEKPAIDALGRSYATGRRKEAVARVWIKPGSGKFNVNKKDDLISFFKRESVCQIVKMPFVATSTLDKYDVFATVKGGGLSGQAGAVAHGISRALGSINDELHAMLRSGGFLTRDSRIVERKKYGQHKARKKCQYSKR